MTPADLDALEALAAAAMDSAAPRDWALYDAALDPATVQQLIAAARRAEPLDLSGSEWAPATTDHVVLLAADYDRLIAAARLGAAWQAAEEALPEGWNIKALIGDGMTWDARAGAYKDGYLSRGLVVVGMGDDPAAALLSLAEALRGRK